MLLEKINHGFIVIYFDEEEKTNIFEGCPPLPPLSPRRRLVVGIKMLGDNIIKLCIKM